MHVTADSYDARVSAAAVTMLAASATFRTLVAAADAAAAQAFIIEDDSGRELRAVNNAAIDLTKAFAVVRLGPVQSELRAVNTWGRSGDGEILLFIPVVTADTPAEQFRRARNAQGLIRADIEAQFGTAGALTAGTFTTERIELGDETTANRLRLIAPLTFSWRDCP